VSTQAQEQWRSALATFTVTNTNDIGAGSLRWAIDKSNANAGADSIIFDIAGSGTQVIDLSTSLPSITDAVTIDGTTQSGWIEQEFIPVVIDGGGGDFNGFTFDGSDAEIGLADLKVMAVLLQMRASDSMGLA